jgi:hypothetical protein
MSELAKQAEFLSNLPNIEKMEVAPLELGGEYWTPQAEGELRRMFFNELKTETTVDPASGKDVELLVAYFVEVNAGQHHVVRNASRRLTGVLESLNVQSGTPLEIVYLGKKKNKTNAFSSDNWSIKPLYLKS